MPLWTQHLLIAIILLACVFAIARQAFASLRGKGKLGNCCARGCQPSDQTTDHPKSAGTAFIPSDSLRLRCRQPTRSAK